MSVIWTLPVDSLAPASLLLHIQPRIWKKYRKTFFLISENVDNFVSLHAYLELTINGKPSNKMRKIYINPACCAYFILGNIKIYICIFNHYSIVRWHTYLKSFLMEDKDLFILHGCSWLGEARGQGISSYGNALVCLEYSNFSSKRVN